MPSLWSAVNGGKVILIASILSVAWPSRAEHDALSQFSRDLAQLVLKQKRSEIENLLPVEFYPKGLEPDDINFLFGEPNQKRSNRYKSVRTILRGIRRLDISFERYFVFVEGRKVEYVRAFYYERSRGDPRGYDQQKINRLWMQQFVTCRLILRGDSWEIARTIFDAETEGPTSR